jgi:hypothetical protein
LRDAGTQSSCGKERGRMINTWPCASQGNAPKIASAARTTGGELRFGLHLHRQHARVKFGRRKWRCRGARAFLLSGPCRIPIWLNPHLRTKLSSNCRSRSPEKFITTRRAPVSPKFAQEAHDCLKKISVAHSLLFHSLNTARDRSQRTRALWTGGPLHQRFSGSTVFGPSDPKY